ncbi:MAG: argininosuccinate lyase [Deltaproteobacteria bacterium]|nr:argininosuccinate lyase [Deltaproteobacteria bacterium]
MNKKPWSGRFQETTNKAVESFTLSVSYDKRLYSCDIEGSMAHCRMLAKVGLMNQEESQQILSGLQEIKTEIETGEFVFRPELEDIHMNIEARLLEKIGPVGGKLHTARSRNDQVLLDLRLYLRDEIRQLIKAVSSLQEALIAQGRRHFGVIIPGYTHLQRAQPVLFSHHLLAYFEMFQRDKERLRECLHRVNVCPLGAGALSGSTLPIDRKMVAEELKFPAITKNSLDTVSDRDFCLEFLSSASILSMHFSRMSEELILWSTAEFSFIDLPDAFCTGSSLMPQKKNPDVPELVRGKTGRIYGHLMGLLTVMKSLPLTYNRDLQEDKEAVFDTIDTLHSICSVLTPLWAKMMINPESMAQAAGDEMMLATDLADYLVRKGIPFRDSHHIIGQAVGYCVKQQKKFSELSLEQWQKFFADFSKDVMRLFSAKASVEAKKSLGGTATVRVQEALQKAEKTLEQENDA